LASLFIPCVEYALEKINTEEVSEWINGIDVPRNKIKFD
jgi:hypothetical protein